jgi:hypothetical protein
VTEDEKLELWRTSAVRRAGWVPLGARHLVDPPGEVNDALHGAIVVAAGGEVLGLEYRWPVDRSGTRAADFQGVLTPRAE